jgi:hypothetical protein
MAYYVGCSTASKVWEDAGYVKYDKFEAWMKPHVSPSQPAPKYVEFISKKGKTYKIRAELLNEVI